MKRSSIPKAGNGAFSRRFLPKGSLVIGSPLLAGFRDNFLFNMTLSASGNVSPEHKSLIYNYHFGHKDSSVLFFPISPVIAINHNSISMSPDHGKEANVKIRFSTKDKKSRYLVHRPLEDIRKVGQMRLRMLSLFNAVVLILCFDLFKRNDTHRWCWN